MIYKFEPGMEHLDLNIGEYLGQMKLEVPLDDPIVEYCSCGPKNYAYRQEKSNAVTVHVKGSVFSVLSLLSCIIFA